MATRYKVCIFNEPYLFSKKTIRTKAISTFYRLIVFFNAKLNDISLRFTSIIDTVCQFQIKIPKSNSWKFSFKTTIQIWTNCCTKWKLKTRFTAFRKKSTEAKEWLVVFYCSNLTCYTMVYYIRCCTKRIPISVYIDIKYIENIHIFFLGKAVACATCEH